MPQDETSQTMDRPETDVVLDDLRVLMRDVRAWLDAMPVAYGLGPDPSDPEMEGMEPALAALDINAACLSALAKQTAEAVQERADQTDAILAEIRRVRAETRAN